MMTRNGICSSGGGGTIEKIISNREKKGGRACWEICDGSIC